MIASRRGQEPPSSHRPDIDPALESICLKAMAKDLEDRYSSMDEFAGALDGFLTAPAPDAIPQEPSRVGTAHRISRCGLRDRVPGAHPTKEAHRQGHPGPKGTPPGRSWWVALASVWAVALMVLGVIIYVATDKGQIRIDVKDPNAVVKIDNGQEVRIEGLGEPITLRAGEHELLVKRGDGEFETRKFVIRRGDNPALSVEFKPKDLFPPSRWSRHRTPDRRGTSARATPRRRSR